jgi:hypothetical protein
MRVDAGDGVAQPTRGSDRLVENVCACKQRGRLRVLFDPCQLRRQRSVADATNGRQGTQQRGGLVVVQSSHTHAGRNQDTYWRGGGDRRACLADAC